MDKKVRIISKGTFENDIEGGQSMVNKDYVDTAHPQDEHFTYQETLDILEGRGNN